MFQYPPDRHSPYFVSQIGIPQLLWILLSLCVLMAMTKPANAAVEQIRPLSGGNQYIWYVFSPSAYPGLVGRDALSACQAVNKVLGTTWKNMSVADRGVYTPAYPYLHQYLCSGTETMNRPFSIIINPIIPPVKAVCPIAMPPFTFNPNTNFCERPICPAGTQLDAAGKVCVEQFTLTFNAPTGDLEPSGTAAGNANSSKTMSVSVKSAQTGLPKNLAKVRITLGVVGGTGGHDHSDLNRPKGTLAGCAAAANLPNNYDCTTGADGKATFTFNSTQVSGTHTASASCISPVCINSQSVVQDVKVAGLSTIPASPFYAFVGATALHSDNHYLTPQAESVLHSIAVSYQYESRFRSIAVDPTNPNDTRPLTLNDASLVWGGVLDIKGNWTKPHAEHRHGTAIDIRANWRTSVGAIPFRLFSQFEDLLSKTKGVTYILECTADKPNIPDSQKHKRVRPTCISQLDGSEDDNRHFHIRLTGVKQ